MSISEAMNDNMNLLFKTELICPNHAKFIQSNQMPHMAARRQFVETWGRAGKCRLASYQYEWDKTITFFGESNWGLV